MELFTFRGHSSHIKTHAKSKNAAGPLCAVQQNPIEPIAIVGRSHGEDFRINFIGALQWLAGFGFGRRLHWP
jgi:hypothetical protein